MAGILIGTDGAFTIGRSAREGLVDEKGDPAGALQPVRMLAAPDMAQMRERVLEVDGSGAAAPGAAMLAPKAENAIPDPGPVSAAPATADASQGRVERPVDFASDAFGEDGSGAFPARTLSEQPIDIMSLSEELEGDAKELLAPLAGLAQAEARLGQTGGEGKAMRPQDAGPQPVTVARITESPGGRPESGASLADVGGETGPAQPSSAEKAEGASAHPDRGRVANAGAGQPGQGVAAHPGAAPEPGKGVVSPEARANHALVEQSAAGPVVGADALGKDQGRPDSALPGEVGPQVTDRQQTGARSDGAGANIAPVHPAAVASRGDRLGEIVRIGPLRERAFQSYGESDPQAPASGRDRAPARIAPAAIANPGLSGATSAAVLDSPVSEADPLRGAEAVAGEPRAAGLPAQAGDPAPMVRADQGRAVAVQIAEVLRASGNRAVELRLQPEELGRISLTMSQEGTQLQVALAAERPETLELMRRHIDLLGEELRRLGHGAVQFTFEDGTGQNRDRTSNPLAPGGQGAGGRPAEPGPPPASARPPAAGVPGGMDIRM